VRPLFYPTSRSPVCVKKYKQKNNKQTKGSVNERTCIRKGGSPPSLPIFSFSLGGGLQGGTRNCAGVPCEHGHVPGGAGKSCSATPPRPGVRGRGPAPKRWSPQAKSCSLSLSVFSSHAAH